MDSAHDDSLWYHQQLTKLTDEIGRLRTDLATYGEEAEADENRIIDAEIAATSLRALLRETIPFINDAGNDEDPETQQRANDLFVRIAAALGQPKI